ncbi:hypothetical protein AQUCO_01500041v1 [Aquilegia coerulea]|uniref:Ferrochelatase n=1 Tax=Aquilegia coerulea TaxID=218851 RepID=A0A2G5DRW8_AQUCA|nr:hypothetical protein AQUCO_01500041v1 [Aquilegia coerulea]
MHFITSNVLWQDIIRLPSLFCFLQKPLAQLISVLRAPKSKEGYASIGGGSPLRKITDEQAQALKLALEAKKLHANVYVAMRYWYPFTEEAVHQTCCATTLSSNPQYSISRSGSSIRLLQNTCLSRLPVSIIQSGYQREGYIKSMANMIEKELKSFSKQEEVDAGDPYRDQMEDCISLIMNELKSRGIDNDHTLAYQSRVGPVQWLKPYTDEVLVELGQKGVKNLLAVPVSFVSEHIETLEEIDMEYRELALESGIENWGRVPALGCTSSFISDLADAVIEALPFATAISPENSTKKSTSAESDTNIMRYVLALFFGSVVSFVLLFFPKLASAFKNYI